MCKPTDTALFALDTTLHEFLQDIKAAPTLEHEIECLEELVETLLKELPVSTNEKQSVLRSIIDSPSMVRVKKWVERSNWL